MKGRKLLTILTIALLAQNCAKQTAPTGGPKDETPPKLVKTNPTHEQTKFDGKSLELTFDESIQLNNPREQIVITPSIGKKFLVEAKKDKVVLNFNTPLKDSTTYNINFREAIQDLNEKNAAKGIKIAFSTGTYIDSLSISGNVRDALTDKEAKNFTVAAIQPSDTFNVFKHPGTWVTQTDEVGNFSLENLKSSNYFVYAFDDKNKNLVIDSKTEVYGFINKEINLKQSIDSIQIRTIKLDASKLKLISSRPSYTYYQLKLSKSLINYEIKTDNRKIFSCLDADQSTIKIYNTMQLTDSLLISLTAEDSLNNVLDSTLYLKFNNQNTTKEKFTSKTEQFNYLENKSLIQINVTFSKPVIHFNQDSVYIQLDSTTKVSFNDKDFTWNNDYTKLAITKKFTLPKTEIKPQTEKQPKGNNQQIPPKTINIPNQLFFQKGAFISAESDTLEKSVQNIKIIQSEQTGVLITKVETAHNFILQVVNKNDMVIQEITNQKNYQFENLPPETYKLRLQIDYNKNGKWDSGNIKSKTLPEPVIYYFNSKKEKEISLKANWEVGPLLITF